MSDMSDHRNDMMSSLLHFCKKLQIRCVFGKTSSVCHKTVGKINKKFILKQLCLDFIYKRSWVNSALTKHQILQFFVQNISFFAAIKFFKAGFNFKMI